jgi:hypothetical protein
MKGKARNKSTKKGIGEHKCETCTNYKIMAAVRTQATQSARLSRPRRTLIELKVKYKGCEKAINTYNEIYDKSFVDGEQALINRARIAGRKARYTYFMPPCELEVSLLFNNCKPAVVAYFEGFHEKLPKANLIKVAKNAGASVKTCPSREQLELKYDHNEDAINAFLKAFQKANPAKMLTVNEEVTLTTQNQINFRELVKNGELIRKIAKKDGNVIKIHFFEKLKTENFGDKVKALFKNIFSGKRHFRTYFKRPIYENFSIYVKLAKNSPLKNASEAVVLRIIISLILAKGRYSKEQIEALAKSEIVDDILPLSYLVPIDNEFNQLNEFQSLAKDGVSEEEVESFENPECEDDLVLPEYHVSSDNELNKLFDDFNDYLESENKISKYSSGQVGKARIENAFLPGYKSIKDRNKQNKSLNLSGDMSSDKTLVKNKRMM